MSEKLKRKIIIVILVVLCIVIYKLFLRGITAQSIRNWVNSFGILAPIAYIGVWVILPIFFFPVPILALAGGLSFGFLEGTILTLIGAMINSTIMFILANVLAKDMVTKYLSNKLPAKWWNKFYRAEKKEGFIIVLICRLIPIMPYNVINYISGLTNIKFGSYFIATLIGITPGTVIFLNVGDKILDVRSPEFLMSIIFVVILTVVSLILGRYVSQIGEKKSEKKSVENKRKDSL